MKRNLYHFFLLFQVFPIRHLQIFSEEELERLLCGELDSWAVCISLSVDKCSYSDLFASSLLISFTLLSQQLNELLDHIKLDHGYTASSPPILNVSGFQVN